MSVQKRLLKKEVKEVVLKFWDLNASRAPITDFIPILDDRFVMSMRGTKIKFKGIAGLADHQMGKLIFFDQSFILKSMRIDIQSDSAVAKSKAVWQARQWQSPAANSQLLKAEVWHTWKIERSSKHRQAVIVEHICEKLKYLPGFSPVEVKKDFHLRKKFSTFKKK